MKKYTPYQPTKEDISDTLYDSETNEYLDADALGITQEEYDEYCEQSCGCGQAEGHISINGRRVYASM